MPPRRTLILPPDTTLCRHAAATFDLLPDKRWAALSGQAKDAYNEARLNYHSEMIICRPPRPTATLLGRVAC